MPSALKVCSNDGKTNMSAETWAAYSSGGVVETEGDEAAAFAERAASPPGTTLTAARVEQMLADRADWKLMVRIAGQPEVLPKAEVAEVWRAPAAGDEVTASYRLPTPDEERVLEADKDVGPLKRLADARAVPAALFGTLAAIGAAAALLEKGKSSELIIAGFLLALAAFVISAWGTLALKARTVRWARLDELESRHNERVRGDLKRIRIPGILTLAAIVCFGLGFVIGGEDPAAAASVTQPATTETARGLTASVEVHWTHLGEEVAEVRTEVTGGRVPVRRQTERGSDGTVKQKIKVPLDAAGDISVVTRAYNSEGKPVGKGVVETFAVKSPAVGG